MSSPKIISEECEQSQGQHVQLIYGLPDDLSVLCLSRVPRQFHHILRCVCTRWRDILCSEEWHYCRSKWNLHESWIYALCENRSSRLNGLYQLDPNPPVWSWKLLEPPPSRCLDREGMGFESVGHKLFLLGGGSYKMGATDEVYCYDAYTEKWEEVARMPNPRWHFLSAAVGDKIYVTGGVVDSLKNSNMWDVYDCRSNEWRSHRDAPAGIPPHAKVQSFVFEGKIFVANEMSMDGQLFARVYDPMTRKWEDAGRQMSTCGPATAVQEGLCMLDESYGTKLMVWKKETNEWVPLGRLAHRLTNPPCQLAAIGSRVFVVGRNLSTVVIDTGKAVPVDRLLVGSSLLPKQGADLHVLGCKTLAI